MNADETESNVIRAAMETQSGDSDVDPEWLSTNEMESNVLPGSSKILKKKIWILEMPEK